MWWQPSINPWYLGWSENPISYQYHQSFFVSLFELDIALSPGPWYLQQIQHQCTPALLRCLKPPFTVLPNNYTTIWSSSKSYLSKYSLQPFVLSCSTMYLYLVIQPSSNYLALSCALLLSCYLQPPFLYSQKYLLVQPTTSKLDSI